MQRGQVASVNSHDGPEPGQGAVLDEVAFCCKALRCLTADRRRYNGQVDSSTPEVGYQCSGDEPLIQRRTAIILPDDRLVPYDYGAENSIDDVLNRVASIHDDATLEVLADPSARIGSGMDGGGAGARRVWNATVCIPNQFGYLGAAMPAITTLPTPALQRRWRKLPGTPDGDGGDPYCPLPLVDDLRNGFPCNEPLIAAKQSAYDRFSRTKQSLWVKDTGTGLESRVHAQWGFNALPRQRHRCNGLRRRRPDTAWPERSEGNRNSLRTWRKDLLAPAATQQDQAFLNDQLRQIINRQRGVLNINHTAAGGIPAETEAWDHDEQGNWRTYDTTEDGQPAIEQTRGHNTSNQITKIDGSSANVAHDANGNMTLVPTSAPTGPQGNLEGPPLKTTWDAWDRTRLVHDQNDVLIQDNRYDGLTRRTQEVTAAGTRHFYNNDQWRSVEERIDSDTTPERQHIWHPADRWTMIRRDCPRSQTRDDLRDGFAPNEPLIAAKQCDTNADGTLDKHLWCLKDDLDPVAIADQSGAIVERLAYTAFGIATVLTPAFEPRSGNQSDFAWNLLFHVEFADPMTGWMNYGYRFYVPVLGRWLGKDPLGLNGGLNLYGFLGSTAINFVDLTGKHALPPPRMDIWDRGVYDFSKGGRGPRMERPDDGAESAARYNELDRIRKEAAEFRGDQLRATGIKAARLAAYATIKGPRQGLFWNGAWSFRHGVEYGGRICCKDGNYIISGPVTTGQRNSFTRGGFVYTPTENGHADGYIPYGRSEKTPPEYDDQPMPDTGELAPCADGWKQVAGYHSHPGGGGLSDQDWLMIDLDRLPEFVGVVNTAGVIEYLGGVQIGNPRGHLERHESVPGDPRPPLGR